MTIRSSEISHLLPSSGALSACWLVFGLPCSWSFLNGMLLEQLAKKPSVLHFGRLRPLHTNAVIFAFVGNGIFMGFYYSLQRLFKARMSSDMLSKIHFWGWQLIIVAAAITLPLGIQPVKNMPNWNGRLILPSLLSGLCLVGICLATILKRRERHLYVAIWFYIATFVTVAMLHIVNSFELPV